MEDMEEKHEIQTRQYDEELARLDKELDRLEKRLAISYSFLVVVPVCAILWFGYYYNYLSAFIYLPLIAAVAVISLVLLIVFRKKKYWRITLSFVSILTLAFLLFEFPLINYESHTYQVTSFSEPEDLLGNSGIHIMSVNINDIHYIENEEIVRESFEYQGIQVFDIRAVENHERYRGKTRDIKRWLHLGKRDFEVMTINVQNYINENVAEINEFLGRENIVGDSAGLALGLTAFVHSGELENSVSIGVTGTLEKNGRVNPVGAIKEKLLIAEQSGLPVIILPSTNEDEAFAVKEEHGLAIEIITVNHIDEAITVVNGLNGS